MLADEPPVSRVHAGGVISVRITGGTSTAGAHGGDQRSGNPKRTAVDFRHSSEDLENQECRRTSVGLSEATITWRNGAQRDNDILCCRDEIPGAATIPIRARSPPVAEATAPVANSEQLVHIIRVQNSRPVQTTTDSGDTDMEKSFKLTSPDHIPGKVRITTTSEGDFRLVTSNKFCHDKISLAVGSPLNGINKAEDERSSSGASSAPASDCERSDSDREGDDGTDSGFSTSRCLRTNNIVLNAKNAANGSPMCKSYDSAAVTANRGCKNTSGISSVVKANHNPSGITKVPVGSAKNGGVKLSISSYADKTDEKQNILLISDADAEDIWNMQFHLRELDSTATNAKVDNGDIQSKITAAHALLSGPDDGIFSLKNKVKSSINSLLVQSTVHRNYDQEEMGRVVFYTTSMGIIRNTYDRCRKVRKILETLMVRFEERDVFMNRGFQQEVRERLGISRVLVPQLFVEGRHLGVAEVVEQLNEIGHLRELLRPYKRHSVGGVCCSCGGYKYLLCSVCGGSKKSVTHRHHFSEDLVALRCVSCDESGLIRCPECVNGEG